MCGTDTTAREDALYRALITAEAYPALRAAIDAGVFLDETDPFALRRGARASTASPRTSTAACRAAGRGERRRGPRSTIADIADDKRYREAQKAVRQAEKALRDARKLERMVAREARERRCSAAPDG